VRLIFAPLPLKDMDGCFGVHFMVIRRDHASFRRKNGDLLIQRDTVSGLCLSLMDIYA
jgi:hypothetical protein